MQIVIERPAFTQELGEKSRFSVPNSLRIRSVNPTGMVDLITTTACGLMAIASRITASTVPVLEVVGVSGS